MIDNYRYGSNNTNRPGRPRRRRRPVSGQARRPARPRRGSDRPRVGRLPSHGRRPGPGQAAPLSADGLAAILATAARPRTDGRGVESHTTAQRRGRTDAVIAGLLFMGGLRRSEVSALEWHARRAAFRRQRSESAWRSRPQPGYRAGRAGRCLAWAGCGSATPAATRCSRQAIGGGSPSGRYRRIGRAG